MPYLHGNASASVAGFRSKHAGIRGKLRAQPVNLLTGNFDTSAHANQCQRGVIVKRASVTDAIAIRLQVPQLRLSGERTQILKLVVVQQHVFKYIET